MKKLIGLLVLVFTTTCVIPSLAYADDTSTDVAIAININNANVDQLSQLKGIGESKAKAIIDWREKHGPFETVDQLLAVNGIGQSTLDSIRPQITLE